MEKTLPPTLFDRHVLRYAEERSELLSPTNPGSKIFPEQKPPPLPAHKPKSTQYDPGIHHPIAHPQAQWTRISGGSNPIWKVSVGSDRYFVKQPIYNPSDYGVEPTARRILRTLGFNEIPHIETTEHPTKGQLLVGEYAPLTVIREIHEDDPDAPEYRRRIDPQRASRLMTAEWLLHASDRNSGNYGFTGSGQLTPIDYGETFHPLPWLDYPDDERLRTRWISPVHNDMLRFLSQPDRPNHDLPIDRNWIRHLLDNRHYIEQEVRNGVLPHFADWPEAQQRIMEMLGEKFGDLVALYQKPRPTLRDLPAYMGATRVEG